MDPVKLGRTYKQPIYDDVMPKVRFTEHFKFKLWVPIKTRAVHTCALCRQPIGKRSIAYKPTPPGGIVSFRICAACVHEALRTKMAVEEND